MAKNASEGTVSKDKDEDEGTPVDKDGDESASFTIVQAKAMAEEIRNETPAHTNQYRADAVSEHYLSSLPEGTALKESDLHHVALVSILVSRR